MRTFYNKFLIVIFVIMLFVIVGEIGYYFVGDKIFKTNVTDNIKNINNNFNDKACLLSSTDSRQNKVIDLSQVEYLAKLEKTNWTTKRLHETEGIVKDFQYVSENSMLLTIVNNSGKEIEKFVPSKNKSVVNRLEIYELDKQGNLVKARLSDVKNGYRIIISRYFDAEKKIENSFLKTQIVIKEK